MAKRRDYKREYRRRTRREPGQKRLPTKIARGHGVLPVGVARRLESGDLTAEDREKYGDAIERYESRYGPATSERPYRGAILKERFDSREDVENYLYDAGIPIEYVEIIRVAGTYRIKRLR